MKLQHFPESLHWMSELEEAVADAERALRVCDWEKLDEANNLQPRLMHGLRNALEAERPVAGEIENKEMNERIDCILRVRASQIERLKTFRDEVKMRLVELSHFRKVARDAQLKEADVSTFCVSR